MGREPTTARDHAARARILQAATVLVHERGVMLVTLDDVQESAGVRRSQMYRYFDDRDDLVRSMVSSTVDAVLAHKNPLLSEVDSLAGIERWFTDVVANSAQQDSVGGCPIGSLARQLAENDEVTRAAFVNAIERWQSSLIAGLGRMQQRGELRQDVRIADLADTTMAAIQGGLLLAQIRRNPAHLPLAMQAARAALRAALPRNAPMPAAYT